MTWVGVAGFLVLLDYVQATNGCSRLQQVRACHVYMSDNVIASRRHHLGQEDNAYAHNNLRDMCWGGQASRSRYGCGDGHYAPGGTVCLKENLLKFLMDLSWGRYVIKELAGGCHTPSSGHYSGLAVDLYRDYRQFDYVEECSRHGGLARFETALIHCQFDDVVHR